MPARSLTRSLSLVVLVAAVVGVVLGVLAGSGPARTGGGPRARGGRARFSRPKPAADGPAPRTRFAAPAPGAEPGPNLAPGSKVSALPSDVLIADRTNSRLLIVSPTGKVVWTFPRSGDLAPGQTFKIPDDAFFTPDGKEIVATEEDDQVVSIIDVATHRIVWRYGTPGTPGGGPNHVSNPDDAMMLPDGDLVLADIKNCSILFLKPHQRVPVARVGVETNACYHQPPERFGSPNGAFPLAGHNLLVTEINGDWVDAMAPSGHLLWSTRPPGVAYPSDTNQVGPNRFLTADYSNPGQIVEFDRGGKLLWRFGSSSGPDRMNRPSLCMPVPTNGDVLCNDDFNDRVIVVDPRTNRIVWQYGHTGVTGTAPGYLNRPDGVDLVPPYSLAVRGAQGMAAAPTHCAAGLPSGTCTFGAAAARPGS